MIRKIIKQGHNTLTVTLPSIWAKRFNLEAGNEINILERDNGLFITSEKITKPSEIEIDIKNLTIPLIWKHVNTAYRAGYDKITLRFNPDASYDSPYSFFAHNINDFAFVKRGKLTPLEFVHQMSDRYVGVEVIDSGKDFCVLKEIGQSTSKEFDNSLRRVFLLLLYMSEGIINDLESDKRVFLDKAHTTDTQIDKFHDFCARVLNKTGIEEPAKSYLTFTILYLLELIGDEFKHLSVQILKKKKDELNSKKLIGFLKSINEQLKMFYELYYVYAPEKLLALSKINRSMLDNGGNGGGDKKKGYTEDVQVTVGTINRYIDVLLELLIAKNHK